MVGTDKICIEITRYLSLYQPVKAGSAIKHGVFILPLKPNTVK